MNEHWLRWSRCSGVAGALLLGLSGPAAGGEGAVAPPVGTDGPLSLRRALEIAMERAPEVAAAAAAEREAEAAARVASAAPRPEVWTSTSPGYAAGVPAPLLGELPAVARVEARATLFDSARSADEQVARAHVADAASAAASARVRVARTTGELFSRCLLDDRLAAAASARAAARQSALERLEALSREGRLTDLDVARGRLAEAEARQAAADARSSRELDLLALRGQLGWPAGAPLELEPGSVADLPPEEVGPDALARARTADPELQGLARADASLQKAVRLRGRVLSPVVEATAQYSRLYKTADWDTYYPTFQPNNWAIGAVVTVPLWTGGRTAAEEARVRASLERVGADRRARERDLEIALERAEEALERTRGHRDLARQREALADEALRSARALSAEGRVDAVEVAEREAALAEAGAEAARADHEWLVARLDRLALLGSLPPALPTSGSGRRD